MTTQETRDTKPQPLRDLIDPFIAFARAPRALWGVNLTYLIEGMSYFGILTLLAIYFNRVVGLSDALAGWIVGAFTGGITLAMFFFGELADRWGVRVALALSLLLMLLGRMLLAGGDSLGGTGLWSPVFLASTGGLLLVILGYGMYQPAAYVAVRQFTTPRNAAMGYAALYAVMNLGAFLPGLVSPPIRAAYGITGIYWVYTALTALSVVLILAITTTASVRAARLASQGVDDAKERAETARTRPPFELRRWLREHPLRDIRFSFFIFILIPVQTLFAHQWLTLPQYVDRAFPSWVSQNMEFFVNLNPLLIFVLTPIAAALTSRVDVYRMMIIGTAVMAAPTFLLALEPNVGFLMTYIVLMSVGEAMWQPRFLQLAAELAPEGKTGQYMGIAQFPWFLTKLLTGLYSGTMLSRYVPETGPQQTELLWLFYALIAMVSPVALFLARKWMGGKMKTTAVGEGS
ncbi:MAG: MFS transporter [Bacteroidota bacterium]|jgi:MFS family permease|nr:MFS transporter [Bacteroidota bacterium]